jgi:prolyl-tRNA synthetase
MVWRDAFIYTLREEPADAELTSHKLMTRAGMIMKVSSGIYNYLPLGLRVIRKIENIIREEMKTEHATEMLMPSVIPANLWQDSGRWDYYGNELLRLKDRKSNEYCLGPTHEEVVVDVARRSIKSYRDMPFTLYQFQTKFRDEIRPRFGLMRGREFIMKDAYSFHTSAEDLDKKYWEMHAAYTRIFSRMGLKFRPVEADSGAIGGDVTHEFHVLADSGEDKIIFCESCDYAANVEKAVKSNNDDFNETPAEAKTPEDVETPDTKSIEQVSSFLDIDAKKTIKMVVYKIDDEKLIAVLIRGDLDINEIKLKNYFAANSIEIPTEVELLDAGLAVGYMGPIGFTEDIEIVSDFSVRGVEGGVIGANKANFHTTNVYPSRDFENVTYDDFGFTDAGDNCKCGGKLSSCRGIEVGQVFKLGRKYSSAMGLEYLDNNGKTATPTMGCYGIGVGRTAASAVEQNSDENGIIWPIEIAPYMVSILSLDHQKEAAAEIANSLHEALEEAGIDTLLDDRKERAGIKFKDHDLIGVPLQVVIGNRGVKSGELEMKVRATGEKITVAVDNLAETVIAKVKELVNA